jgi:hypothetical protein
VETFDIGAAKSHQLRGRKGTVRKTMPQTVRPVEANEPGSLLILKQLSETSTVDFLLGDSASFFINLPDKARVLVSNDPSIAATFMLLECLSLGLVFEATTVRRVPLAKVVPEGFQVHGANGSVSAI